MLLRWLGRWCVALVVTLIVPLVTSCSRGPAGPDTVPVSGKVVYKGAPVDGATVTFSPVSGDMPVAVGVTRSDGTFVLRLATGKTGAVPGRYKVTVVKTQAVGAGTGNEEVGEPQPAPIDSGPLVKPQYVIPPRYANVDQTPLTAEVKAEGTNDLTFELTD